MWLIIMFSGAAIACAADIIITDMRQCGDFRRLREHIQSIAGNYRYRGKRRDRLRPAWWPFGRKRRRTSL